MYKYKKVIIVFVVFVSLCLIGFICIFRDNTSNPNLDVNEELDNRVVDILIPYDNIVLKVGDTFNINASVLPSSVDSDILYDIENDVIASVDAYGVITALNVGSTVLTVSSGDVSVLCNLEVVALGNLPESVEIVNSNSKIKIGDIIELKLDFGSEFDLTPNVNWTSSDNSIASVNSAGVVTAKSLGDVYITVNTSNGLSSSIKLNIDKKTDIELPSDNDIKDDSVSNDITGDIDNKPNSNVGNVGDDTSNNSSTNNSSTNNSFNDKNDNLLNNETSVNIDQCNFASKILTYVGKGNQSLTKCKNVSYKSSDSSVVAVNKNGVITPKKIGTAIITATLNGKSKDIVVYVDHNKIVKGNNTLVLYDVLNASAVSDNYKVYVKLPEETNYHQIQVFKAQVSFVDMDYNWHSTYTYYTNFDFKGVVNVKVVPKNSFSGFRTRGNIPSQNSKKNNNEILFNLKSNGVISVETKTSTTDYNIFNNLQIFANPLDGNFDTLNINDDNTIYIAPGEHKCKKGVCSYDSDKGILIDKSTSKTSFSSYPSTINLKSNSKLYISGSAVVHSQIALDKWNDNTKKGTKITNVSILGRGTLDTSDLIVSDLNNKEIVFADSKINAGLIRVIYSNNIKVDGIMLKNATAYNLYFKDSDNISISNVKVISAGKYTDGIHVLSSRNIKAENIFIRTDDDSIAIYSSRRGGGFISGSFLGLNGNTLNGTFKNLLLWNDNGRSIFIGGHGDYNTVFGKGNKISDISFTKVRILESNRRLEFEGALTVGSADNNYVKNIAFNDVEIDHLLEGNFITVRNYCSNYSEETYKNTLANKCGYMINNVVFNNVKWTGKYKNTYNVKSWISVTGTKTSNAKTCSVNNNDHVVSLVKFNNVMIGNNKLSASNKSLNHSNIPIYNSNSCIYNLEMN